MSTEHTTDGRQPKAAPKGLRELLARGPHTAMLMTMIDNEHSSRPVTIADCDDRCLMFLVSVSADWVRPITDVSTAVHVAVADERRNVYLALNGRCSIGNDDAEIDRLWTPAAHAYFKGPNDPDLVVLHFRVTDGEYWTGPSGGLGQVVAMFAAAATGNPSKLGDHGDVATN